MSSAVVPQPEFAPLMARGVAELRPEDLTQGNLTLELGLSLWLRRSGAGLDEAIDAMLAVRDALVAAGGLDRRSEPVPLLAGDLRTAVLSLAVYLDGLVARASFASGCTRGDVVDRALQLLRD